MSISAVPLAVLAWIAGGVAITVVALYLLRRTPRSQTVSNIEFWAQAVLPLRPRFLRAKQIPVWSLLVTLLVALLYVFVLGGPRFGNHVRGTTVIVLAAGQTMGASSARGVRRIDRAIDELRLWFGRATSGGEVAVLRAGKHCTVLVPLTSGNSGVTLPRTLEVDDGPSNLEDAVRVADGIVKRSGGVGQIVLIADRPSRANTATPQVLAPIGVHSENIAITALSARRNASAVGEYAFQCEVSSFTSRRAGARLTIRDRQTLIYDQRFVLDAHQSQRFSGQGFSSEQGELKAELTEIDIAASEDALDTDNVAYAVVEPLKVIRVLVVTPGNPWLQRVFQAHGAVEVTMVTPAALTEDRVLAHDVVILDRVASSFPIRDAGELWIDPVASHDRVLEHPVITTVASDHEALGGVSLDGVRIERAYPIAVESSDHVLLRSANDALMIARESRRKRKLVVGFELDSTDLVHRVGFPLMMHHAIAWLSGGLPTAALARRPGVPLVVDRDVTVLGPSGDRVEPTNGQIEDTRPGIYHVGSRAVAYSSTPSDRPLSVAAPSEASADISFLPPLHALAGALLLALVALEWALLNRGRLA